MSERNLAGLSGCVLPKGFPSPFDLEPHPIAQVAARDLQEQLQSISSEEHDFFTPHGGKMFGVLVVQSNDLAGNGDGDSGLAYLAAFSGMLAGQWLREGFSPPVFDLIEREQLLGDGVSRLRVIEKEIDTRLQSPERTVLQHKLAALAAQQKHALAEAKRHFQHRRQQRQWIRSRLNCGTGLETRHQNLSNTNVRSFDQSAVDDLALQSQRDKSEYKTLKKSWAQRVGTIQAQLDDVDAAIAQLKSTRKTLSGKLQEKLFSGYRLTSGNDSRECTGKPVTDFFRDALPPGGTGDCASIKLLHQCYKLNLKPVCLAEFWWGSSPPGGVRHHLHFYPACRGKCRPILPYMLGGLNVSSPRYELLQDFPPQEPRTLFEDEHILVVVKPAGMLSVAGKTISDSVEYRLQSRYPMLVPAQLSRLLIHRLDQATSGVMVAAKNADCHKALHQQFERREVDKCYVAVVNGLIANDTGVVDLPLRVDLDDRPRQMVCYQHGKPAKTHYRVLSRTDSQSRLQLSPVTGRTHQLRVHLAHPSGLNAPIVGDELYGNAADRLHLHAEQLDFRHPVTGEALSFHSPATF